MRQKQKHKLMMLLLVIKLILDLSPCFIQTFFQDHKNIHMLLYVESLYNFLLDLLDHGFQIYSICILVKL